MTDQQSSPARLITISQAWFEPCVVAEKLPVIDPELLGKVYLQLDVQLSVRAWLGRGPTEHPVGATAMLFFQSSDESYPVFSQPSLSPKGSSLQLSKAPRTLIAGEHSAVFCVEVASCTPVPTEKFEEALKQDPDPTAVEAALEVTKSALDKIVGAFALYQYPLVWRFLEDRHMYLLVNTETRAGTRRWEKPRADNYIPFRLDASAKLNGPMLNDGVIKAAAAIVGGAAHEPLALLKDSMWHSDIRTRFLLQFWILEYFAEQFSATLPLDDENRRFVQTVEALVAAHAPDDLPRFRSKKGELLRRPLAEKVKACLGHFKVQYDDALFKRAKRVRDALSHGSRYQQQELVLMEHYIREVARYLLQRDLEYKGIFLDGLAKPVAELTQIVPMFVTKAGKEQTATFGPI
jgi:hypothetical protein